MFQNLENKVNSFRRTLASAAAGVANFWNNSLDHNLAQLDTLTHASFDNPSGFSSFHVKYWYQFTCTYNYKNHKMEGKL